MVSSIVFLIIPIYLTKITEEIIIHLIFSIQNEIIKFNNYKRRNGNIGFYNGK
jgi:hypothetical protein